MCIKLEKILNDRKKRTATFEEECQLTFLEGSSVERLDDSQLIKVSRGFDQDL